MTKIYEKENYGLAVGKLYNKKIESNDLLGALSLVDKTESLYGANSQTYAMRATIYYDMGLYEESANNWFKYLSVCKEKQRARGYNGLGACFYNLDDKSLAGYYFNEQLKTKDKTIYEYNGVGAEFFDEIYDKKSEYYIAYPYEIADFTKVINTSADLIKIKDFKGALNVLSVIPKESKYYGDALIQKSLCCFFMDKVEDSLNYIDEALTLNPNDLIALCNAISLNCDAGNKDKVKKLVERLSSNKSSTEFDNLYKVFMVYCEVGEHALAEEVAEKFLKKEPYNLNVLFLYGLVEYNLRKFERAQEVLLKCYRISKNYVHKYYYILASKQVKSKVKTKSKLKYSFDILDVGRKPLLSQVAKYVVDPKKEVDKTLLDDFISYAIQTNSYSLQSSFVTLLFKMDNEFSFNKLKELLIDSKCFDRIKSGIIGYFTSKGLSGDFPLVFYNTFKFITIYKADFYDESNTVFSDAYAFSMGKLCPVEDDLLPIKTTAEEMYNLAKEYGFLNEITDAKSLSAVIFECSKIKPSINRRMLNKFFDANIRKTKQIRDLFVNIGYIKK